VQLPKQLPPVLLDCLRYFLHVGQQLQESRRQQQRQAAIILEQQQQAAAAAATAAAVSSSSSAGQDAPEDKPAEEKPDIHATSKPGSDDAAEQNPDPVKEPSKPADDENDDAEMRSASDVEGDQACQPAADEDTDALKPEVADDTASECTSTTAEDQKGGKARVEGTGISCKYQCPRFSFLRSTPLA